MKALARSEVMSEDELMIQLFARVRNLRVINRWRKSENCQTMSLEYMGIVQVSLCFFL
jgi:hypothetical protein